MFRKLFLILLLIAGLSALELKDKYKIQPVDILKGTIMHVFEDIVDSGNVQANTSPVVRPKIAKTRINSEPDQELSLIELDTNKVKMGDQILIAKLDSSNNFGLGDSFEDKLVFVDFARDHFIYWLLLPLLLLLSAFSNKKTMFAIIPLLTNVLLIFAILPLCFTLKIPVFYFCIIFIAANTYLGKYIFNSERFVLANMTAIPVVFITGLLYAGFAHLAKIDEAGYIIKNTLLTITNNTPNLDLPIIIIAGYLIYLYTSLFFISVTYRRNLYLNFSNAVWLITLLYFLLFTGLNLPTIMYFYYNGLGLFHLFNFLPFCQLLIKFMFLYWGNIFCCLFYLLSFYLKHKQHFQKHIQVQETRHHTSQPIYLTDILASRKEDKYNKLAAPKRQSKPAVKASAKKPSYLKRISKISKKKTLYKKLRQKKRRR